MPSRRKGISSSATTYKRTSPSWLKISPQDVKSVTGSKILRMLKAHGVKLLFFACNIGTVTLLVLFPPLCLGLAPEILENLYHLIKKAVSIGKHLERNREDKDSKFRLILVESSIHGWLITTRRQRSFHMYGSMNLQLPVLLWPESEMIDEDGVSFYLHCSF